jgi:hypothetical protein
LLEFSAQRGNALAGLRSKSSKTFQVTADDFPAITPRPDIGVDGALPHGPTLRFSQFSGDDTTH